MSALTIISPPNRQPEREYIISVVLGEFLGLSYRIRWQDSDHVCIACDSGKRLQIDDSFFRCPESDWLRSSSLPKTPVPEWRPIPEMRHVLADPLSLPVLFGQVPQSNPFVPGDILTIPIDIFGSCFFMLSRYEEAIVDRCDAYGRFRAADCIAFQGGFLDRPLVNEYLEILWLAMKSLWPQLTRKRRQWRILPTHDVDAPFRFGTAKHGLRAFAGDLLKRRQPIQAARTLYNGGRAMLGLGHRDEFDTFDWLMEQSERAGCQSVFYFMAGHNYSIDSPPIRALLRKIRQRGHDIGVHPDLGTRDDADQLSREVEQLRITLAEEGIEQDSLGGRQHFLSWRSPTTWQLYEDVGLQHDATLTYCDQAGFRCGVCYEYPVFNLRTRQRLQLIERPLLAMECSLFLEKYMALDWERADQFLQKILQNVRRYQGQFQILWHNHWFYRSHQEQEFFQEILQNMTA